MIPLHKCQHGVLYRLKARRLLYGVYDSETQCFVGLAANSTGRRLATEIHKALPSGTAAPLDGLEVCPFEDLVDSCELREWLAGVPGRHK